MAIFKDEILDSIKQELQASWSKKAEKEINKKLRASSKQGSDKHMYKLSLENQSRIKFNNLWQSTFDNQLRGQIEDLSELLSSKVTNRHLWLLSEENAYNNPNSLLNKFLFQNIRKILTDSLKNKTNNWQDFEIELTANFNEDELSDGINIIEAEVAGYPLSNIDLYDDRELPSFLENPFEKSITRYDIYRLLKKTSPRNFTPKKLSNQVFCTKVAPFHHSEIALLSDEEWTYLETVIINISDEENPKWIILDKKNEPYTIHTNESLAAETNALKTAEPRLKEATENIITCLGAEYYSNNVDWNSILFSRILPWTQLIDRKVDLDSFRSTMPVSILTQNLIESSCLDAQLASKKSSLRAFNRRYPLSEYTENEIFLNHYDDFQCLIPNIVNSEAVTIIEKLDIGSIVFDRDSNIITINSNEAEYEALKIIYFFDISSIELNINPTEILKDWYSFNLSITEVSATNPSNCAYMFACAARNRFLKIYKPFYLSEALDQFSARKQAWNNTGQFIYEYLSSNQQTPRQTQNIAEMGKDGLNTLFSYINTNINEPINLNCTISLESGNSCLIKEYVEHFKTKIQTLNTKCKPLFSHLNLALPNYLNPENTTSICELLNTINRQDELKDINFVNAGVITAEFLSSLTDYVVENKICLQINIPEWDEDVFTNPAKSLLKAQYRNLQNQILNNIRTSKKVKISANTKSIEEPAYIANPLTLAGEDPIAQEWGTNKYKLSNEVAGIQQQAQQEVAQEVQQQAEQQKEPPPPIKREITTLPNGYELINRSNLDAYGIDAIDFSTWVGSSRDGQFTIQQIDKKALEQIQKYHNLFKFGVDPERTPGFRLYYAANDDRSLVLTFEQNLVEADINQLNNDPFAVRMNDRNPTREFVGDYRQLYGFSSEENEQMLLWACMAPNYQDEAYFHYILEANNAEELKNTLTKWAGCDSRFTQQIFADYNDENLKDFKNLILTKNLFFKIREFQLLSAEFQQKQITLADAKQKAQEIFLAESNVTKDEITPVFRNRIIKPSPLKVQQWLHKNAPGHITEEYMQYQDIHPEMRLDSLQMPDDYLDKFEDIISSWYQEDIKILLRNVTSNGNTANMMAFGQLFYHYGYLGTKKWIDLHQKIKDAFNNHFDIYTNSILSQLEDWSECLEKSEVDAVTTCIEKIAKSPIHTNIFWQLVETHGNTVDRMRFSEVWNAYDMVISYINDHDLEINQEQFTNAINKYNGQFNATHFLSRIYSVLQNTSSRRDSHEIQQNILENLSSIDWREDGLAYAITHEHYRYWDASLEFHELNTLTDKQYGSYVANWDTVGLATITNPKAYALRFAALQLKLNFTRFQEFKNIIEKIDSNCGANKAAVMRLATAAISIGIDSLESLKTINWAELNNPNYQSNLEYINQQISLDATELNQGAFHVKMQDLSILLNKLQINTNTNLEYINALGRGLQSFKANKQSSLEKLIVFANNNTFSSPLLKAYPWLINEEEPTLEALSSIEDNEEIQKFYQQLTSINFELSTSLPDAGTLDSHLRNITDADTRHAAIKSICDSGCLITDQDADFSPLPINLSEQIDELYLAKTFAEQNRKLLHELFRHLAIKPEGNDRQKVQDFLELCAELGRKSHFDELGQLLGLLIEKSDNNKFYSLEQLTGWLNSVFDATEFKTKPYPVTFIKILLEDTLVDENSSLLVNISDLNKLKTAEAKLDTLQVIMTRINLLSLPYAAKKALVQSAIANKRDYDLITTTETLEEIFTQIKHTPQVTAELCKYIDLQLTNGNKDNLKTDFVLLDKITKPLGSDNQILMKLWLTCQVKLLKDLTTEKIEKSIIQQLAEISDPYTRMIITQAIIYTDKSRDITSLTSILNGLNREGKVRLAEYYATDPKPTINDLKKILTTNRGDVERAINQYETEILPAGKRTYSLSPDDTINISRILRGLKLKGKGYISQPEQARLLNLLFYTNNYSKSINLETKNYAEIREIIQKSIETSNDEYESDENRNAAKARVLACIREVITRKTGKWMHHTQMMDLIYSVTHDDNNILHQIRMGEGKSLISLARVAYRALNGRVVDVFSSKDSLSSRDHLESAPVLDTLGIRHSHITPSSNEDQYHNNIIDGLGAAHYSTIGSWSLFMTRNFWEGSTGTENIDLFAEWRDAFLDEGDHLMRVEDTLFNFSDQVGGSAVYNYDAWAVRITYNYFKEIEHNFEIANFEIQEDIHLQELFNRLRDGFKTIAPTESRLFQDKIAINDPEARNKKLLELLTAARIASGLIEGGPFCVMDETKEISDSAAIDTRVAKVMINSQVYHGSTYSDYVQQFLHERLNQEAAANNQIPNFFMDPESEIVLSLVAPYILQHYFQHLEAVTGTPGDLDALKFYLEAFNFQRIIKLPTHLENRTLFLEPIYCEGENLEDAQDFQVQAIVNSILNNPEQPILVTCEDEHEVEILGNLISNALGEREPSVVIDKSSSGLSEAEILHNAGKNGAVTVSARLGRGSDIKPENKEIGLRVIRTYPADPEVVKQEQGRQGRFGAPGVCQDIINYKKVLQELNKYTEHPNYNRELADIRENESAHLEDKIKKHSDKGFTHKEIWRKISEQPDLKTKYLNTRVLQKLKHNLKEESKKAMRAKSSLLIQGSARVMEYLRTTNDINIKNQVKTEWRECKKLMERTTDQEIAENALYELCSKFDIPNLYPQINELVASDYHDDVSRSDITDQIIFYQSWVGNICTPDFCHSPDVRNAIFGEDDTGLASLFYNFLNLDIESMQMLNSTITNKPLCQYIPCKAWEQALQLLEDPEVKANFDSRLEAFFSKENTFPTNPEEVKQLQRKFIAAIEGTPEKDFIIDIIDEEFAGTEALYLKDIVSSNVFNKKVVQLCKNYMNEEDIIFLLKKIYVFQDKANHILNFLESESVNLKSNPSLIRPLLTLIACDCPLPQQLNNNGLLYEFLSARPGFSERELNKLENKIMRIAEDKRERFIDLLMTIPAHVSLNSILKDLSTEPPRNGAWCGFERTINRINNCGQSFAEFLYRYNIIDSKYEYNPPRDPNLYNEWQAKFNEFNLDSRETLFNEIKKHPYLNIQQIKNLTTESNPNPATLQQELINLQRERLQPEVSTPKSKSGGFFNSKGSKENQDSNQTSQPFRGFWG